MASSDGKSLRVGLAGLGAVGMAVARRLAAGVPGLEPRRGVGARRGGRGGAARRAPASTRRSWHSPRSPSASDIVVEALPAALFRAAAEPAIAAGRIFMPLSVGALLDNLDLVERAKATGARIIVPTGRAAGARRGAGRRRGRDPQRAHDHAQAAGRA